MLCTTGSCMPGCSAGVGRLVAFRCPASFGKMGDAKTIGLPSTMIGWLSIGPYAELNCDCCGAWCIIVGMRCGIVDRAAQYRHENTMNERTIMSMKRNDHDALLRRFPSTSQTSSVQ